MSGAWGLRTGGWEYGSEEVPSGVGLQGESGSSLGGCRRGEQGVSVGGSRGRSPMHGEGGRGAASRAARMGAQVGCEAWCEGTGRGAGGGGEGGLAGRLRKASSKAATGFSSALTAFSAAPSLRVSRSAAPGLGPHAGVGTLVGA